MKRFALKKDGATCGYATAWAKRTKAGWVPMLNVKEDPERPLTHATKDHRITVAADMAFKATAIRVAAEAAARWANQYGAHATEIAI